MAYPPGRAGPNFNPSIPPLDATAASQTQQAAQAAELPSTESQANIININIHPQITVSPYLLPNYFPIAIAPTSSPSSAPTMQATSSLSASSPSSTPTMQTASSLSSPSSTPTMQTASSLSASSPSSTPTMQTASSLSTFRTITPETIASDTDILIANFFRSSREHQMQILPQLQRLLQCQFELTRLQLLQTEQQMRISEQQHSFATHSFTTPAPTFNLTVQAPLQPAAFSQAQPLAQHTVTPQPVPQPLSQVHSVSTITPSSSAPTSLTRATPQANKPATPTTSRVTSGTKGKKRKQSASSSASSSSDAVSETGPKKHLSSPGQSLSLPSEGLSSSSSLPSEEELKNESTLNISDASVLFDADLGDAAISQEELDEILRRDIDSRNSKGNDSQ